MELKPVNKFICCCIVASLGLFSSASLFAIGESLESEISRCIKLKQKLERKINNISKNISKKRSYGASLKIEEKKVGRNISATNEEINKLEIAIREKEEELKKLEIDLENSYNQLRDIMSKIYKSSENISLVSVLNTKGFLDQDDKYSIYEALGDYGNELISKIKASNKDITAVKKQLEDEKRKYENLNATYRSQKADLEHKEQQNGADIINLSREEKSDKLKLDKILIEQRNLENKLAQIQKASAGKSTLKRGNSRYLCPLATRIVTSPFGPRKCFGGRMHWGLDLAASSGTPVRAAAAGRVIVANFKDSWGSGWGYYVMVDHGDGYATNYAHLSRVPVRVGQAVHAGEIIGYSGNTGHSTGPHLHFETWHNGRRYDPATEI